MDAMTEHETDTSLSTTTTSAPYVHPRPRRVSPRRLLEVCEEHPRIANALQCRYIEMRAENVTCDTDMLDTMIHEEYDRLRESECGPDDQLVSKKSVKRALKAAVQKEMFRLPVFTQGEILPLKYRIKNDIRNAIVQKYGKKRRQNIENYIDELLGDYCSLMKRPDYAWAAIMKKKRYDIYGNPVGNVSAKDMAAFVAALRFHERKAAEREARREARLQAKALYIKQCAEEVAK
ncbi:MAG: ProQ/FINO family protein [Acidithiobacillus sp.]|nr:ProQ/FINO family protein [Acidithiobacillus sp.]